MSTDISSLRYTNARGYGNTTKFINYTKFEELEVLPFQERFNMITRIFDRLSHPMETSRADDRELIAYQLRTIFLIEALIPSLARTEYMKEFRAIPISPVQFIMDPLGEAILGYEKALYYFRIGGEYEHHFDNAEIDFGEYRHEKWLASQQ